MNSTSTRSLFGLIAASLSVTTWALTGIFVKSLPGFSSFQIVSGRCLVGLLASLLIFIGYPRVFGSPWHWKNTMMLGLLMTIYYLMVVTAYQFASVAEVAILTNTTPLFALIHKRVTGHVVTRKELVGLLMASSGVFLIILAGNKSTSDLNDTRIWGDLLALTAGASMAVYSIFYKGLSEKSKPSPIKVSFITFLSGSALGWLLSGVVNRDLSFMADFMQDDALYCILGLGIVATLVPTLLYAYASSFVSPLIVTSLRLLTPLFASALAISLLSEIPSPWFWVGAVLLLPGLYLIIKTK